MNKLSTFVLGLVVTFGLPWLFLIVIPTLRSASLGAVAYEDADGNTKYFPESNVFANGQLVYKAEGCANCHTQMIRAPFAGLDGWRAGWGADQEDRPTEITRASRQRDYLGEPYAFLGSQRNGPDLSNVGYRITDDNWHHSHLFDPRSIHPWSTMPSFRHLYEKQEIQGGGSSNAVATDGDFEYVPGPKAKALVQYLRSLKKDSAAPALSSGDVVEPEADEASAEAGPDA